MDTLSHGLWGGIMFGRQNRKSFWISFAFGVLPDLLVFTPTVLALIFTVLRGGIAEWVPPQPEEMPTYVHIGYSITHSLIIFALAFAAMWLVRKRPLYEMLAWPAHILLDIPTHSANFFPTPFLWPFAHPVVNGISWSHPAIFIPNVALLAVLYGWYFIGRKKYWRWKAKNMLDRSSASEEH